MVAVWVVVWWAHKIGWYRNGTTLIVDYTTPEKLVND